MPPLRNFRGGVPGLAAGVRDLRASWFAHHSHSAISSPSVFARPRTAVLTIPDVLSGPLPVKPRPRRRASYCQEAYPSATCFSVAAPSVADSVLQRPKPGQGPRQTRRLEYRDRQTRRGGDRVSTLAAPMGCRTQPCWLNRNRRLAKDFEASIANATTWIYIASVQT